MPKSNYGGKTSSEWFLTNLHAHAPIARVLDVGPGMGLYPKLLRKEGQHWIGVEAWGPYIKKFDLTGKYNQVIVSDIRYFDWKTVAPLDLVICGDVLEHMTRAEALQVVEKALSAARIVLISMPIVHAPQGEYEGNPFEVHVEEDWTNEAALAAFPDWCVNILESYIGVYIVSRQANDRMILGRLADILTNYIAQNDAMAKAIAINVNPSLRAGG